MVLTLTLILTLAFLAVLALPFFTRQLTEPLPDTSDPVRRDLEEERDALLRAIHELGERNDLSEERRQHLQGRYEAKAAGVLKKLDELERPQEVTPTPRKRRISAGFALLGILIVPSVALIGNYALPRVSQSGTVTTNREGDIASGRALKQLQRAAQRDPNAENLLALADTYWQLANESLATIQQSGNAPTVDTQPRYLEETRTTYRQIVDEVNPVPSVAYRRLGYVALLENDIEAARPYLESALQSDPEDSEARYTLGEVLYYLGDMAGAADAFESFLATSTGEGNEAAQTLAENARTLAPLSAAAEAERSEVNLMALGDAFWNLEERNRAANLYSEVITKLEAENPRALSRVGQALFFAGDAERAVIALDRASVLAPNDLDTLLFLGNAYFSLGDDGRAVDVWQRYVEVAGGPEQAGRVPSLIAQAEARQQGEAPGALAQTPLPEVNRTPSSATLPPATAQEETQNTTQDPMQNPVQATTVSSGASLFAANCASCHGANAQGGAGPKLAGSQRVANTEMVRSTVQYGRGMMPGFGSLLSADELDSVVAYVTGLAQE